MRKLIAALAVLFSLATPAAACPSHLGCGCHLGEYLRVASRDLWLARNWLTKFNVAPHGCIGCVVVTSRAHGGHVGVVKGYDANGNPIVYSWGNSRIGWHTQVYPKSHVLGYRNV